MEIKYSKKSNEQYDMLQKSARAKAKILIKAIEDNPTGGIGQVERLKGYDGNRYSRRIDRKNRLIYDYLEDRNLVVIISMLGHYADH
jgi:toxin YoeB